MKRISEPEIRKAVTIDNAVDAQLLSCQKEHDEEMGRLFKEIEDIVSQEPELTNNMPDDIWEELQDRKNAEIVLRATVRSTKKNIIKNLESLKAKYLGGK